MLTSTKCSNNISILKSTLSISLKYVKIITTDSKRIVSINIEIFLRATTLNVNIILTIDDYLPCRQIHDLSDKKTEQSVKIRRVYINPGFLTKCKTHEHNFHYWTPFHICSMH